MGGSPCRLTTHPPPRCGKAPAALIAQKRGLPEWQGQDHAKAMAVLGNMRHAKAPRRCRIKPARAVPDRSLNVEPPGLGSEHARQERKQLALAVTSHPGNADNLARVQIEVHTRNPSGTLRISPGQVAHRQGDGPFGRCLQNVGTLKLNPTPHHGLRELIEAALRNRTVKDDLARAQDRHCVT